MAFIDRRAALNLSVRGLTIGSRFVLMFLLGRYFSTQEVGQYGLFYTTISVSLLAVGFDFYTFANREVLNADPAARLGLLRGQLLFYGYTYLLFVVPVTIIFLYGVLPVSLLLLFVCILVTEHFSQELYRLFTILSQPVFANTLLFIRSGAWVLALCLYFLFYGVGAGSLNTIFWSWFGGSLVSLVLGVTRLLRLYGRFPVSSLPAGWHRQGVRTAAMYFLSTLSLLAIEHANRYMIKYWCGLPELGVFTLFSQIANIINVVVFTLFIMIIFPKLIEAYNKRDIDGYYAVKKMFRNRVIAVSAVLFAAVGIFIFPVLAFVKNAEYNRHLPVFYALALANVFMNISYVYHYGLYAMKEDRRLLVASLWGAAVSVALNVVLIGIFGLMGAACALLASYVCITLLKKNQLSKAEHVLQPHS